jgi:hypothetical protein
MLKKCLVPGAKIVKPGGSGMVRISGTGRSKMEAKPPVSTIPLEAASIDN